MRYLDFFFFVADRRLQVESRALSVLKDHMIQLLIQYLNLLYTISLKPVLKYSY